MTPAMYIALGFALGALVACSFFAAFLEFWFVRVHRALGDELAEVDPQPAAETVR